MTTLHRAIFASTLAFTPALASCESPVDAGGDLDAIVQNDWLAKNIAGDPVPTPERVTLSFANGRVSGRGGCNQYSGPVEYGNGRMKIGPIISTKMACLEDGLMQLESKYLGALQTAESYSVSTGTQLTIATARGPLLFKASPKQIRP